ncbi:MAG: conjugal transfer protein TraN [Halobacteriovoraceae bacterium]|nr:conjugal transfer protein TraN [Halobacteriovoraceae bacterium]
MKSLYASFIALISLSLCYGNTSSVDMNFATKLNNQFGKQKLSTDQVPHYQGEDIEEKKYFNQNTDLKFEGNKKVLSDENGKFIVESSDQRPHFDIDQNDPMLKNMGRLTKNSHDLSDNLKGCKNVKEQQQKSSEKQFCFEYGERSDVFFNCKNSLSVTCKNPDAGMTSSLTLGDFNHTGAYPTSINSSGNTVNFGTIGNSRGGRCQHHHNQITFHIDDINQVKDFIITSIQYDDWASISVNGHNVFDDSYRSNGRFYTPCERSVNFQRGPVNIKNYLVNGTNTINTVNTVYGGGHLWFSLKSTFLKKCDVNETWSRTCDQGESNIFGKIVKNTCTDGPSSKLIKGTSVFKECWNYQELYSKRGPKKYTLDNTCKKLVNNGCGQVSKECLIQEKDYCKKWKVGYSCSQDDVTVSVCAEDLPCPNGDCTKDHPNRTPRDASNDFKKSMSYFSLMKEITDEMDSENPVLFSGKPLKCKKQKLGIKDCCRLKSWGDDIGITKCNASEVELGMARKAKKTIYVGNYKEKGTLYSAKYFVFCSYPSKLARIFIESGKKQLGQGLGEAKNPDCSGINIKDIEKIDFDKIDLSEFHEDMEKVAQNYKEPNLKKHVESIKKKIENQTRKNNENE